MGSPLDRARRLLVPVVSGLVGTSGAGSGAVELNDSDYR